MASSSINEKGINFFKEVAKELTFLRFYYNAAQDHFDPRFDSHENIKRLYRGELPGGY